MLGLQQAGSLDTHPIEHPIMEKPLIPLCDQIFESNLGQFFWQKRPFLLNPMSTNTQ